MEIKHGVKINYNNKVYSTYASHLLPDKQIQQKHQNFTERQTSRNFAF